MLLLDSANEKPTYYEKLGCITSVLAMKKIIVIKLK